MKLVCGAIEISVSEDNPLYKALERFDGEEFRVVFGGEKLPEKKSLSDDKLVSVDKGAVLADFAYVFKDKQESVCMGVISNHVTRFLNSPKITLEEEVGAYAMLRSGEDYLVVDERLVQ